MHVHDLFRLHSRVFCNFEHLLTPAAHALVPLKETSDWEVRRVANLDLFVAEGQRGHPVIIESVPPAPHDLHVLPRHRLLPQSGGFEAIRVSGDQACATTSRTSMSLIVTASLTRDGTLSLMVLAASSDSKTTMLNPESSFRVQYPATNPGACETPGTTLSRNWLVAASRSLT